MRPLAATPKKSSCRRQAATAGRGAEAPAACEVAGAGGSGGAAAWGVGMAVVALLPVCAVGYSMLGCRASAKEDGSSSRPGAKLAPTQAGQPHRSNDLKMACTKRTDRAYCMRRRHGKGTRGPRPGQRQKRRRLSMAGPPLTEAVWLCPTGPSVLCPTGPSVRLHIEMPYVSTHVRMSRRAGWQDAAAAAA